MSCLCLLVCFRCFLPIKKYKRIYLISFICFTVLFYPRQQPVPIHRLGAHDLTGAVPGTGAAWACADQAVAAGVAGGGGQHPAAHHAGVARAAHAAGAHLPALLAALVSTRRVTISFMTTQRIRRRAEIQTFIALRAGTLSRRG